MKKLIIFLLSFFLVSCTSEEVNADFEQMAEDSKTSSYSGTYVSTISTIVEGEDSFDTTTEMSFKIDNNKAYADLGNYEFLMQDGVGFLKSDGTLYEITDEMDPYLAEMLPYGFSSDDIESIRKTENGYEAKLSDNAILVYYELSYSAIDDNLWTVEIEDNKIISETLWVRYHTETDEIERNTTQTFDYEPVSLNFDEFAFLEEEITDFNGHCRFDQGTSSMDEALEIVDGKVVNATITQFTSNDVIAAFTDNVDDYIEQLLSNYAAYDGLTTAIEKTEDGIIITHVIDMNTISDEGLLLIGMDRDGKTEIQSLKRKGFTCQ